MNQRALVKMENTHLPSNISPREQEVLHLISHEKTTQEIADELYISSHTATSHRKNLMRKFQVKNAAGLVRRGFELGYLSGNTHDSSIHIKYDNVNAISHSGSKVLRSAIMTLLFLFSFSSAYTQSNSDFLRSATTAEYFSLTGVSTIKFPVNEDFGSCIDANVMRWMDIHVVDEDDNEVLIAKLGKEFLNICSTPDATTTNGHCFNFDMCNSLPGTTISLENGVGVQKIAVLTVIGLPNSSSKIKFTGRWDNNWFNNGDGFDVNYEIALITGGRYPRTFTENNIDVLDMTVFELPMEKYSLSCNPLGLIYGISCETGDCPNYQTEINPILSNTEFLPEWRIVSSTKGGPYTSAIRLYAGVPITNYEIDISYTGKDDLINPKLDHQIIVDGQQVQGTRNQELIFPFTWRPKLGTDVGFLFVSVTLYNDQSEVGTYSNWIRVFNEGPTAENLPVIDVTQTPVIPRWVIYKPPGDLSTSAFNFATEVCRDLNVTFGSDQTFNSDNDITVGFAFSAGEFVSVDLEFGLTGSSGFETGESLTETESLQTCTTITQGFDTDELYGNEAADSDLIIGISKRQIIAKGDIMYHGPDCKALLKDQLYVYADDTGTYLSAKSRARLTTERDALVADVAAYFNNPNPSSTDSIEALEKNNQIEVYNQFFDQLAQSELNPSYLTLADPEAGLAWTEDYQLSSTESFSYDYQSIATETAGLTGFFNAAGNGFESSKVWTWTETYGQETSSSSSTVEMISYTIKDEEDELKVEVYKNEKFGSPLFRLRPDTRTSCPFEGGILRNIPKLGIQSGCSDIVYLSTDETNAIELPLEICNESNEIRDYRIRIKSNTNNAKITIGSELVAGSITGLFTVGPNSCYSDGNNNPQKILIERLANSSITEASITLEIVPDCFTNDSSDEFNEAETSELEINITFNAPNPLSDLDCDFIPDTEDLCPATPDAALNFDGIDDYVLLPNESDFDITGPITVEAWIKVDEWDIPNQAIVTKGDNTWRISRNWINSTISFALSGVGQLDGSVAVDDNQWHHIAGVYDGSSMSLYIDGVLDVSNTSSGSIATSDDPVIIGSNYQGIPTRFFDGSIDDVIIWDRALSQTEILETMATPIDPADSGLVAYFSFNDAAACQSSTQTTATDLAPLANTGTLMNFSLSDNCISNWSSGANKVNTCNACLDILELTSALGILDGTYSAKDQIILKSGVQFSPNTTVNLNAPIIDFENDVSIPQQATLSTDNTGCQD